jgi:REP-associated tyrosine transposase
MAATVLLKSKKVRNWVLVLVESLPYGLPSKKTCTGKNACATVESSTMTFYRRNLPHWHPEGKTIFITWRLYGSLPASLLKKIRTVPKSSATNPSEPEDFPGQHFRQLDAALDAAKRGPFWLADPEFADYAEYPILHGADLGRFLLHAYVIMPNHVHILLDPFVPLAKISGPLKGVAACDINSRLARTGKPLWQDESFDHWVRNPAEFERIRQYIEWNPVVAGLVARPEDWKWSSAGSPYFKRIVPAAAPATVH